MMNGVCDKPERCDGTSLACPAVTIDECAAPDAGDGPVNAREGCQCGSAGFGALALVPLLRRRRKM